MTALKLIRNSFSFYWKNHLGLLIGVFLTSAILTGSLLVGDSVRSTLKKLADQRLSHIQTGVLGGDRWFTMQLAKESGGVPAILSLGSTALPTGEARVNGVQVLGVPEEFWTLSSTQKIQKGFGVNEELAKRLKVGMGDTVVVRLELPSLISRDAPLSGTTNQEVTLRKKIDFIASAGDLGTFQLSASQQAVPTVYVELEELQGILEKPNAINVILSASDLRENKIFSAEGSENCEVAIDGVQQARLQAAMKAPPRPVPNLLDYGMELKALENSEYAFDLRTERVFLDEFITTGLQEAFPAVTPVLTYLVNGISSEKGRTPYSMVTATDAAIGGIGGALAEDEAIVSQWLAEDQQLKVGDSIEIRYFVVSSGREMVEKTAKFKVKSVLPMENPELRPDWTPNFPGVSDAENCRDWEPGMPVKLDAIRDKDEEYWDKYGTTPKMFISLKAGQNLWSNRFGKLTSLRFPKSQDGAVDLERKLLSHMKLKDIGLVPVALKENSAAAAKGSVDFGGLFIGLSLFLMAGALVFAALLFVFTLEKRASQFGLLLSLGVKVKVIRNCILGEGMCIACAGAVLGLFGGWIYTRLAILGLNEQWKDATVGLHLEFHAQPLTYVVALLATLATAYLTLALSIRGILKTSPKSLLAGEIEIKSKKKSAKLSSKWMKVVALLLGAACLAWFAGKATKPEVQAGMFFGSGFLILMSGLSGFSILLTKFSNPARDRHVSSIGWMGLRNLARRPSRSLSVIGILAGGLFLVIAVNAFRLSAPQDEDVRQTGTGGFRFVAESTLPIYEDLNTEDTAEQYAFDEQLAKQVHWVPFRMREGDDASCLNLNRAQTPVLTGVNPEFLEKNEAFAFASGSWADLNQSFEDEAIPAIADQATAMWGLGKGVGDTLEYQDAQGRTFKVKLVGLLAGSLLQGKILISETQFLEYFPNAAGYQFFLLDAPAGNADQIQKHFVRQLESRGMSLEKAGDRLNRFYAVQNTYIGIFTLLGGLGVLLGTMGLAVLAMRNVLERKGEFALMQAIGFHVSKLRSLVLSEHLALLLGGVLLGAVSAAVSIWPSLQQRLNDLPYELMILLLVGILSFGVVVCVIASVLALRGKLTQNLRVE